MVGPIAKLEQPAGHPCLDRMKRVACHAELKRRKHRPDVKLDDLPYCWASIERRLKPRGQNPRGGARTRTTDHGRAALRRRLRKKIDMLFAHLKHGRLGMGDPNDH